MASSEDAVAMLTAMGFEASQATQALSICGGNVEQAANYLLGGGPPPPPPPAAAAAADATSHSGSSNDNDVRMIHSSVSQYTIDNGKSACTCIALTAAETFLKSCDSGLDQQEAVTVSSAFLQDMVTAGLLAYEQLQSTAGLAVEHLSAEEVMDAGAFSSLQVRGGIRQGVLSRDESNPMGLTQQLANCQDDESWMCVLITKTPETVLVCLPPRNGSGSFVLVDSHPRPQHFEASGSYGRIHSSLSSLATSLSNIFPVTDLGPDIPDMMAIMYNSFDLYPLQLQR